MFNRFKDLYSKQLSKMKEFDDENLKNKLYMNEYNNRFSENLNKKIESSQLRIDKIRKSIQNTKL